MKLHIQHSCENIYTFVHLSDSQPINKKTYKQTYSKKMGKNKNTHLTSNEIIKQLTNNVDHMLTSVNKLEMRNNQQNQQDPNSGYSRVAIALRVAK